MASLELTQKTIKISTCARARFELWISVREGVQAIDCADAGIGKLSYGDFFKFL
jgi:hypothetical protein